MKKTVLFLCALLMVACAFAESVYDYIPKINGRFECDEGFVVKVGGNGISYTISNHTAITDIICMTGNKWTMQFVVRTRGRNTSGTAKYYVITANSGSWFSVTPCSSIPKINSEFWFFNAAVNDNSINLRSIPGVSGRRLGQYQNADTAAFTGGLAGWSAIDGAEDYWYSIEYEGSTAWIYGKYITFPDRVFLSTKMFQNQPASDATGAKGRTGDAEITLMNIKMIDSDSAESEEGVFDTTAEFETGSSSYTITRRFSQTYFAFNNDTLSLSSSAKYQLLPEAGMLFHLVKTNGKWNDLKCLDIEKGTYLTLDKQKNSELLHLTYSSAYAVNQSCTKIAYLGSPSYNKMGDPFSYLLTVRDLTTLEIEQFSCAEAFKPDELWWINDSMLLTASLIHDYEGQAANYLQLISISDGTLTILDSRYIPYNEEWSSAWNYYRKFLPSDSSGEFLYFQGCGLFGYDSDWRLSFQNNMINAEHVMPNGNLIDTFWYKGKQYFAAYEKNHPDDSHLTDFVIYNSAMIEIKRQTINVPFNMIDFIGIQNDAILAGYTYFEWSDY